MRKVLLALLLCLSALPARAQQAVAIQRLGNGTTVTTTLPVSGAAASFADGWNVTLGAKTDAKSTATDGTSTSVVSILKEISFMEQTPASRAVTNAGTFAVQAAQAGTWTVQPGNTANTTAWLVTGTGGTFPITAAALPLPSGAATSALQGVTDADDASIATGQTVALSGGLNMVYDGTVWRRLTVGTAGTAAAQVVTVQGIASMTKLLVTPDSVALPANQSVNVAQLAGTTTDTNSGTKSAGTLRVVLATDQPQLTNKLLVTPDANSAVNLAQVGGTNIVSGGVAGSQSIGGTVATNVAITANPVNLGAQAVSSENTAVTTARQVQLVADLVGKLIVLPYSNPENFVSGVTAAMTGTTSTSILAAPAAGLRNYVTNLTCTNSHATVSTFVLVQDGSGGTTIYEAYAAAVGGGFSISFPAPLRQPTTATAIFVQDVTTSANVICSASGYKGA